MTLPAYPDVHEWTGYRLAKVVKSIRLDDLTAELAREYRIKRDTLEFVTLEARVVDAAESFHWRCLHGVICRCA